MSEGGPAQEAVSDRVLWRTLIDVTPTLKGPSGGQLLPAKMSRVQTAARQDKKQKRKAEEGKLHVKRQEMDKANVRYEPPLLVALCDR
jgi:hypothetical protein